MPTPPAVSELEGRLSGRYRIERLLGRGGMGAVHLARDMQLDRLVAIKELPPEFASDPMLRERFLREVRVAASFSHPNIVPVYAIEDQGSSLAFVMGYVEGESLAERVKRAGPLSPRELVRLLLDIAYSLAYAHGRGVVHRDIKPDNIMIERATGRALLMDFGVARSIDSARSAAQAGMTRVGEVVGTPEYMSPEQATGEEIDGRSDLYSLGLVAYFAATGQIAFGGDSAARVLMRQLTEVLAPTQSVRGDLPPALGTAIDRCVAKDRAVRFPDAESLIVALDAAQAAAPEIPVEVRLFAQEAETLVVIVFFVLLTSIFILTTDAVNNGFFDRMVPVTVLLAVAAGRVMQTRAEAVRLLHQGFSSSSIITGFRQTLGEREARRAQLRRDPSIVKRRRQTMVIGAISLFNAFLLVRTAYGMRTGGPDKYQTPVPAAIMLYSGLICFGFSMVLLLRSPLRKPIWERLFSVVWLGAPGRWLLRSPRRSTSSTRSDIAQPIVQNASTAVAPVVSPSPAAIAPTHAVVASPDVRLNDLETRVTRLEQRINDR